MADESSNTDPRKGRPAMKLAQESNRLQKKIVEGNEDNQSALSQQVALMSSFTETIANYIPKLGFIDAHTQALKLKQDQAFKVLEKIEGHLAKNTEQTQELVDEAPADEESDADQVQPDSEDVGAGADGTPAQEEAAEDGRADADPLEKIAEDVSAIRQIMSDGNEDGRTGVEPPDDDSPVTTSGAKDGDAPKGAKKVGAIGKFLNKIGKLFSVFNLIVMALVASLLTANSELFTKIKQLFGTIMQVFMQIVGLVVEKILPAVTQIFGIMIDIINQLLPPVIEIFTAIVDIVMGIVEALIPVIMAIVDAVMPVILAIVDTLLPIIMSVVDAIMPIIEMMLDVLVPIIDIVLGVMMFIFETILAPMFEAIAPVVEFVGDLFRGLFNGIITMINGVIEGIAMIVGIFSSSKAEEMRAMKMDKIEKDESRDEAKNIDFAQDDATVDAQIQAKLDSGEINQKTADKLKKDKEKFARTQEKDRKEFIQKLDVKETDVKPIGDADAVSLISFKEKTTGETILVDPKSGDANGNYQLYDPEGNPFDVPDIGMGFKNAVMMQAHAAVESLEPETLEEGGGGMFDMAAILGMTPNETQGQDLGNDSLDMADAQQDASSQGGGSTTNSATTISSTVGGSNSKTVILNDAASGSPQDGRGYYATPN